MGALVKPTTKAKKMPGSNGAGTDLTFAKYRNGSNTSWIDCTFIKRRNALNNGWIWIYSTPNGALSGGGAASTSNGTGAGTPSGTATATPGGVNSGNLAYQWFRAGGSPANFTLSNTATAVLGYSYAFAGVGNGVTSSQPAETVYCEITDLDTGAKYQTSNIVIGPLSHTNTTPAFSPFNSVYNGGSGTEFVPVGSSSVTIKLAGGGGKGGTGRGASDPGGGGGGGSGDYETVTRAISPSDWGAPIYWSIGGGGTASISLGGTSTITGSVAAGSLNLSAPGGARGANGQGGGSGGIGGAPNGVNGSDGGAGGAASGGNGGSNGFGGSGGKGGNASGSQAGADGSNGKAEFDWT